MKIHGIALVGVALIACAQPSLAGQGWYLGLGGGWDNQYSSRVDELSVPASGRIDTHDSPVLIGSFGFKFPGVPLRLEVEPGYDWHSVTSFNVGGATSPAWGHVNIASALFNAVYDVPLGDRWKISLGAGIGGGNLHFGSHFTNGGNITDVNRWGLMWQGIGGVAYSITPAMDFFVDYRYRDLQAPTTTVTPNLGVTKTNGVTENAVVAGFRWYVFAAPPPPPPPPPPSPPPPLPPAPPPPPPPVKTFIVFFDFNKANLTAEGQQVVAEAVKTATQTGAVRVLVTGHTDTVGSDSYNQGLSERRAETVKDEMVREGMDGSQVSIEGKSFHDPLVQTGPNVREPQNRRAVIDLGGGG